MKKKYFSLLTAFISLLAIAVYVLLAILFIARVAGGKEFVPQVEKSFWLYEVIQRIGKVGFNMFFSIIGIILSVILMTYRGALTYFYFKVYKSDQTFYKERSGDIVFYSILACIVSIVAGWFFVNGNIIPPEFKFATLPLCIIYVFLCVLPIIELIINAVVKVADQTKEKESEVPTKENIVKELDKLAEETAEKTIKEKEETKEKTEQEESEVL